MERSWRSPGTWRPTRSGRRRQGLRGLRGRLPARRILILSAVLLGLGMVWLAVTGWMARAQLELVRADTQNLRVQLAAGDVAGASAAATSLEVHARRAHALTGGPIWSMAAATPVLGEPVATVRGVTGATDRIGRDAVPALVAVGQALDPARLRDADGRIDLARISTAAPQLAQASAAVDRAVADVTKLAGRTWLPLVDSARADVLAQLGPVASTVRAADRSAQVLPTMLGRDGQKRYLLAFQNSAEARGTGGLPGAFGIAKVENGKINLRNFDSDRVLAGFEGDVDFGPDYAQWYRGARTTTQYGNANLSSHFPFAAQTWASMWKKRTGNQVDGVIALDPTVLSYLLRAAGPVTLADQTPVTAANVVALTQQVAYARFPNLTDDEARRQFLVDIAQASSEAITSVGADPTQLLKGLGTAAGERRLLVWSNDPKVQATLAETAVAGIVPESAAPYAGLSIVNEAGNKLDYYLDRALTWRRSGCGQWSSVSATIELTNDAPKSGLSSTVTNRSDVHSYPTRPGDNRLAVGYLATAGAALESVTIDGKPATARSGVERGHPVFSVDVEIPRGKTRVVKLNLIEPAVGGAPTVLRQPLVRPLDVFIEDGQCS